jgi:hypothetical protein
MASEIAMKIKNSKQVEDFLSTLSSAVGTTVKYEEAFRYIDDYYCEKYMSKPYLPLFNNPNLLRTASSPFLK